MFSEMEDVSDSYLACFTASKHRVTGEVNVQSKLAYISLTTTDVPSEAPSLSLSLLLSRPCLVPLSISLSLPLFPLFPLPLSLSANK